MTVESNDVTVLGHRLKSLVPLRRQFVLATFLKLRTSYG